MAKDRFSQQDVNKEVFPHLPKPTLRTWLLQGLYGWVNEVEDKRGTSREYSLGNLYQIGIVEALSALDISTDSIIKIIEELGDNPPMENKIIATKSTLPKETINKATELMKKADTFKKQGFLSPEKYRALKTDKHFKSIYLWNTLIIGPEQLKYFIQLQEETIKAPVFVIIDLTIIKNIIDSAVKDI